MIVASVSSFLLRVKYSASRARATSSGCTHTSITPRSAASWSSTSKRRIPYGGYAPWSGILDVSMFLHVARKSPAGGDVISTEELRTADEVGSQLVRLVRLIERVQAQYQAEHPDAVDRATYLLLVHLVKDGAHRAGALAEAVHSDPSTVSRQVAHLVQLGLVERVADPADGRATLLVATAEGRRVFDENRQLRNRASPP